MYGLERLMADSGAWNWAQNPINASEMAGKELFIVKRGMSLLAGSRGRDFSLRQGTENQALKQRRNFHVFALCVYQELSRF